MAKITLKEFLRRWDHLFVWAALLTIPAFLIETYFHPSAALFIALEIFSWAVWGLLLVELVMKWYTREGSTPHFISKNFISIAILLLPLIRILSFVKIVYISRLIQQFEVASVFKDIKRIVDLRRIFGV